MPKVKIIEPGEIVTPPTPLPVPSPTYETEGGERYTAQGEVITAPRNRYTGDTHAEIPEYEGSYFVTENGTIPCGGYEMISDLVVNVEPKGLTQITITANGTYKPTEYDGYSQVVVNVQPNLTALTATENKTYTPTAPVQGFSSVTVNVPVGGNTLKTLLDATKNAQNLFYGYQGDDIADLIQPNDTSEVANMNSMFAYCYNITSVPLLNTSKVTNMSYMFSGCGKITSVPLFDTSNVTNMEYMFQSCIALTTIPLLNTSKVTSMSNMFNGCIHLTSIPLFDTSNVTSMSSMFYSCQSITSIPLFDTREVTNMSNMFRNCSSLTSIPALDASKVTSFTNTFSGCFALTEIHMTGMSRDFNISASTLFSESALVEILNNLADLTGGTTRILSMGADNLAKLTQAEKDIALNKNWTLA